MLDHMDIDRDLHGQLEIHTWSRIKFSFKFIRFMDPEHNSSCTVYEYHVGEFPALKDLKWPILGHFKTFVNERPKPRFLFSTFFKVKFLITYIHYTAIIS